MLHDTLVNKVLYRTPEGTQTLYSNCSISLNCSSVNLPGWTPLTSRPKSLNLEGSAVGGRGRGTVSIVIVISRSNIFCRGEARRYGTCSDLYASWFGPFLIACALDCSLLATSVFVNGWEVPATEASGYHSLLLERGNRDHKYREGCFEVTPPKAALGSVSIILTIIRVGLLQLVSVDVV